jgi:hypothetical protein
MYVAGTQAQDDGEWEKAAECFSILTSVEPKNANYLYHYAYCLQEIAPTVGEKGEREYHAKAKGFYEVVTDPYYRDLYSISKSTDGHLLCMFPASASHRPSASRSGFTFVEAVLFMIHVQW